MIDITTPPEVQVIMNLGRMFVRSYPYDILLWTSLNNDVNTVDDINLNSATL